MKLSEIMTLKEVAIKYGISKDTLHYRMKFLTEGLDYKSLGERQPILLSPEGINKIIQSYK